MFSKTQSNILRRASLKLCSPLLQLWTGLLPDLSPPTRGGPSFLPACTANPTALGETYMALRSPLHREKCSTVFLCLCCKWRIKKRGGSALVYCFMTALFEGSVVPVQSRKFVTAVIHLFPNVTTPVSHSLGRAQSSIHSTLLWDKGTFLNQLLFLGNGPITPVCGPDAPPAPLYIPIHHLSLQEKATTFGSQLQHLSWEDREMKCWDGKFNRFPQAIIPNTTSPSFCCCKV